MHGGKNEQVSSRGNLWPSNRVVERSELPPHQSVYTFALYYQAIEFIKAKYETIMSEVVPEKKVYIHVIAARVRMDMKIMFSEVKDQLRQTYGRK